LILSCYHYDSSVGRYSPFAWGIVRLASGVTFALLAGLLVVLWRREVRRRRAPPADPPARQRPS
jgi:protein SCO1/2